jgi:hypothetical protein
MPCNALAPSVSDILVRAALIQVFSIVWIGAGVVTVNALLLGGNISFFQSVCLLGYCIFPLNVAAILCRLWNQFFYHLLLVGVCFCWSTYASVGFLAACVPEDRKALAVYPVLLFYLCIGWMIIIQ